MAKRVRTYSARGALYTMIFCLLLMGGGAVIMYMSAAETLACSRAGGGRASCRLTRTVLGTPLGRDLGFVQGAEVKTSTDTRWFGQSARQRSFQPVSWVVYRTDGGLVDGVQGESFADPAQLVRDLTAYLAAPSQSAFTATITPRGRAHRFAWWTFWAGAAILALWVLGWLFPGLRPKPRP